MAIPLCVAVPLALYIDWIGDQSGAEVHSVDSG